MNPLEPSPTSVTTALAALLGTLIAEDTLHPIDKPNEVWTRCPCCEVGPNRHKLTITLDPFTLECRDGCAPERIRGRLQNHTSRQPARETAREHGTAREPRETAREHSTADEPRETARPPSGTGVAPSDTGITRLSDTGNTSLVVEQVLSSDSSAVAEGERRRREISTLGCNEEIVTAALPIIGVDSSKTEFPCPVPSHDGSASLYRRGPRSSFKIACSCADTEQPKHWTLGVVYAMRAGRRDSDLSDLETAVWFHRFFFEAGAISPTPVAVPALPNATPKHEQVRAGFILLLGLRWLTHPGQPVAYGKSFAAAWSGPADSTTQLALNAMKQHGVMVEVDRARNRSKLYLPGEVPA